MLELLMALVRFVYCCSLFGAPRWSICSWYGEECQGNLTANSEVYDCYLPSCAHVDWPMGDHALTFYGTDMLLVRINDRIPKVYHREVDFSLAAFKRLAPLDRGVIRCYVFHVPGDVKIPSWLGVRRDNNEQDESASSISKSSIITTIPAQIVETLR